MGKFLFRFGYCTPIQWRANDEHGWDDESSGAFFVEAETIDSAESWGCEVVEAFCKQLFTQSRWPGKIPSWRESEFAFWIESEPELLPELYLEKLPTTISGQMPDLIEWEKAIKELGVSLHI
jgi:hypothetical protein